MGDEKLKEVFSKFGKITSYKVVSPTCLTYLVGISFSDLPSHDKRGTMPGIFMTFNQTCWHRCMCYATVGVWFLVLALLIQGQRSPHVLGWHSPNSWAALLFYYNYHQIVCMRLWMDYFIYHYFCLNQSNCVHCCFIFTNILHMCFNDKWLIGSIYLHTGCQSRQLNSSQIILQSWPMVKPR